MQRNLRVNGFGFDWTFDTCWFHAPFRLIGKIWRKLKEQGARATIIVPLWTSTTWWHLIAPDAIHLSEFVADWMWLPRNNPSLFVSGQTPSGRVISPPDWQIMALRVDFLAALSTADDVDGTTDLSVGDAAQNNPILCYPRASYSKPSFYRKNI
jgi:hypothetical protein